MAEYLVSLKVHRVEYLCDECGEDTVRYIPPKGAVLEARYYHVCDTCKHPTYLTSRYPHIAYEEAPND